MPGAWRNTSANHPTSGNTAEAQKLDLLSQQGFAVGSNWIVEGGFNVVDDELPTSRRFLKMYKQRKGGFLSIPVPYRLAYFLSALWEDYSERSQGQLPPNFNRRRCSAEWKGNQYSNEKLKRLLGWTPRVPFEQASKLYLDSLAVNS